MKKLFLIAISGIATHISFGQHTTAWPALTTPNAKIGINTKPTSSSTALPNFDLQVHGTTDYFEDDAVTGLAQDNEGNKPQLNTEKILQNLGKTSRIGLTNTTTGLTNLDGTVLRMSGTNFTLQNNEAGDIAIKVPNVSMLFSSSSKRIFVGGLSSPTSISYANFNIAPSSTENGIYIHNNGTGTYGLAIRTAVNTNDAIQVLGYYGTNVKKFSVKGNGDVTSGNIAAAGNLSISAPISSNGISLSTSGNSNINYRVTNEGEVFSKTESTEKLNIISNPNSDALVITTLGNSTPKFAVNNNGEVTSGNTYILGTLRVVNDNGNQFSVDNAGYVRAREIKVNLLSIPDYVFKSDYKLMPLKELEQYISMNKHLPNIKSELEYQNENGIEIGELNVKLLEKVEELTLYIIDLQKQIELINKANK